MPAPSRQERCRRDTTGSTHPANGVARSVAKKGLPCCNRVSDEDYGDFRAAYGGPDILTWPGFRDLADAQELRWTAFALSKADATDGALQQARHRTACLRGEVDRPWTWSAL